MNETITGAMIGAFGAIIINGLIFSLSRRNELNKERIQVKSEIVSNLYSQLRYSKRFIGHQIWLNYYQRILPLISKPEFHLVTNNKIEYRIKVIEEIEMKFIDSDTHLSTLATKYRTLFKSDKKVPKYLNEIKNYIISDDIKIEDFKNWKDKKLLDIERIEEIRNEEINALKQLESTFTPMIYNLIEYLE